MQRLIFDRLIKWKDKDISYPILLSGSRQVGKTFIVKEFAQKFYLHNHIYINFFEETELKDNLQNITSPKVIIEIIERYYRTHLSDDCLIIFDEIQEVPSLKIALKLFVDNDFKYKIICTGSYLANTLNKKDQSFPVGKVEFWDMYPMNFKEFLLANKKDEYIDIVQYAVDNIAPLNKNDHNMLMTLLREYLYTGGMPEVVQAYINGASEFEISEIKRKIYKGYKMDITKFIDGNVNKRKCLSIYESLNKFHAKKHNRFILSKIDSNARYLNFENAIMNILLSRIVYKINDVKRLTAPLYQVDDPSFFKLYFNDCGLLTYTFAFKKDDIENKNNKYANQRGSLAENFVISEFYNNLTDYNPHFFTFTEAKLNEEVNKKKVAKESEDEKKSKKNYEMDIILEDDEGYIVPIEIKSGTDFTTKTLDKLMDDNNVSYGVIMSANNLKILPEKKIIEIPLYFAGFIDLTNNRFRLLKDKNKYFK